LVNSSFSELGQFNFECCPLVQQISSVIYYMPCFGGGLLLCLFTASSALSALPLFSGTGSVCHLPPLLSMFDCSLLFVFQFCGAVQFWMLVSGSGDHLYDPLLILLHEWLIACLFSAFTAFPVFIH
jgi:hypothetical protein